jgi:hypothetical protein
MFGSACGRMAKRQHSAQDAPAARAASQGRMSAFSIASANSLPRAPALCRVVEAADQHVGQHVQAPHEVELLEHHGAARAPVAERPPAQRRHVAPLEQDAAGGGLGEAIHHAEQGGLAGTGPADDADHLPRRKGEAHAVDRRHAVEAAAQFLQFQHRPAPVPPAPYPRGVTGR